MADDRGIIFARPATCLAMGNLSKRAGNSTPNLEDHHDSPVRPLSQAWITDDLVAETRRVWSPAYGRVLSDEEAVEILMNVKRFAEAILKAA